MFLRKPDQPPEGLQFLHATVVELKASIEKLSDKIDAEINHNKERVNHLEIDMAQLKQAGAISAIIGGALVVGLCGLAVTKLFGPSSNSRTGSPNLVQTFR